jgi:hypothetical protein
MARLETRVTRLAQAIQPQAMMVMVMCYDRDEGVGWAEPGCETVEDALQRVRSRGPNDVVILLHAWGCALRGTPHSHAHDPVQRWRIQP